MNFVGHVHVARAVTEVPAVLLGAMLPDFASMCGARLLAPAHPALAVGVALHQCTDDAFHACPAFVALCSSTAGSLEAHGIGWGSARAIAHVGAEMLLDGLLLEGIAGDAAACRDAYLQGVAALREPEIERAIRLDGRGAARWPAARARALSGTMPEVYRDPAAVADLLIRILADRPRLAVDPARKPLLERAMARLREEVGRAAPALLAAARAGAESMAGEARRRYPANPR